MMGTEIDAVFLKRRIQPVMSRAHPMWLYSGPMDETRVNAAELSEKELLDEVRHLTHFRQEDSIPLLSLQPPFDADHPPTKVVSYFLLYQMFHSNCTLIFLSFCLIFLIPSTGPAISRTFSRYFG
jgi:hypothetical protein